ncbi:MAG: hypothetical protein RLN62_02700 [Rickettsiales bacterium]
MSKLQVINSAYQTKYFDKTESKKLFYDLFSKCKEEVIFSIISKTQQRFNKIVLDSSDSPVKLDEVIDKVLSVLALDIYRKNITITTTFLSFKNSYVLNSGYSVIFQQIYSLINLLVKHSRRNNKIELFFKKKGERLELCVKEKGYLLSLVGYNDRTILAKSNQSDLVLSWKELKQSFRLHNIKCEVKSTKGLPNCLRLRYTLYKENRKAENQDRVVYLQNKKNKNC